MTVVLLIAAGYVVVLVVTLALLTVAKRSDEAMERARDVLARDGRLVDLDSARFARATVDADADAEPATRSHAGHRP